MDPYDFTFGSYKFSVRYCDNENQQNAKLRTLNEKTSHTRQKSNIY